MMSVTSAVSQIAAAYFSNPDHALSAKDAAAVVGAIQGEIVRLTGGRQLGDWAGAIPHIRGLDAIPHIRALYSSLAKDLRPAVDPRKSVFKTHLICLDCGKPWKILRRHLRTEHKLTPDQYRARWALPGNYPMTAPEYAAKRSALAKRLGLGKRGPKRGRRRA